MRVPTFEVKYLHKGVPQKAKFIFWPGGLNLAASMCKEIEYQKFYLQNWPRLPKGFDFWEISTKWAWNHQFSRFAQNSAKSGIDIK